MLYAIKNGTRVKAEPGARANCPICNAETIAKCGEIKIWHWAHLANDCDLWHENESEWHINWKNRFPEECREVIIGKHRADVMMSHLVIELQASSISGEEIREREKFYGDMVWLIKADEFWDNLHTYDHGNWMGFYWKWARKSWCSANRPMILDTGNGLFLIKRLRGEGRSGWGTWITDEKFMRLCGATDTDEFKIKTYSKAIKRVFKCRKCNREFIGHTVLEDLIYRIDDDCDGTVDDLVLVN